MRIHPREPEKGDLLCGRAVRIDQEHRGVIVDVFYSVFMPIRFLTESEQSDPDACIGRFVECEIDDIVVDKRCIVVRPLTWADNEDDEQEIRNRVDAHWYGTKTIAAMTDNKQLSD